MPRMGRDNCRVKCSCGGFGLLVCYAHISCQKTFSFRDLRLSCSSEMYWSCDVFHAFKQQTYTNSKHNHLNLNKNTHIVEGVLVTFPITGHFASISKFRDAFLT